MAKGTKYFDFITEKKDTTNKFVGTNENFTGNTYKGFKGLLSGRNLKGSVFLLIKIIY